MRNEFPLPYYLQQPEITKDKFTSFTLLPNTVQSLQITMNPYLIDGLSLSSNEPLIVFTGTDSEYSVEGYSIQLEKILFSTYVTPKKNTTLHKNWIQIRPALIQTILDGAAQNWFADLTIEIKSNWKRFTQFFLSNVRL